MVPGNPVFRVETGVLVNVGPRMSLFVSDPVSMVIFADWGFFQQPAKL